MLLLLFMGINCCLCDFIIYGIWIFVEVGVEFVYFFLLRDLFLFRLDVIIFGGGYLEIYVEWLIVNKLMLYVVWVFVFVGGIVYGECGGFMYLL